MSYHWKPVVVIVLAFLVVSLFVLSSPQNNLFRATAFVSDDGGTPHSHIMHSGEFANIGSVKRVNDIELQQPTVSDIDSRIRDQNDHPEMALKHISESVTSQTHGSTCTPARDVVYIKVHKTGSSTLQNIFYRFGDDRDLTFMLPVQYVYIKGVEQFEPSSVLQPPPGKHYNILANHVRLFYQDFKRIMPADTKFVTLIREAASHFSSMYSYFVMKRQYRVELEEFSLEPKLYFEEYDINKTNRFSGRDPQLFDLGFDKKDMYNANKVDDYIQFLDEKMDLVLLTEYFLESLILLKDLMCWDMQTIVHLNIKVRVPIRRENGAKNSDTNSTKPDALTKRLNEWNLGDFKLYDHFNRTLWQKVDAYGRSRMESEITELQELCRRYESECMSGTSVLDVEYWSKVRPFGLKEYVLRKEKTHNMTCKRLGMSALEFLEYLRKKHETRL